MARSSSVISRSTHAAPLSARSGPRATAERKGIQEELQEAPATFLCHHDGRQAGNVRRYSRWHVHRWRGSDRRSGFAEQARADIAQEQLLERQLELLDRRLKRQPFPPLDIVGGVCGGLSERLHAPELDQLELAPNLVGDRPEVVVDLDP